MRLPPELRRFAAALQSPRHQELPVLRQEREWGQEPAQVQQLSPRERVPAARAPPPLAPALPGPDWPMRCQRKPLRPEPESLSLQGQAQRLRAPVAA